MERRVLPRLKALTLLLLLVCLSLRLPPHEGAYAESLDCLPDAPLAQSQVLRLYLQSDIMGFRVPFLVYLPKGYGGGELYPVWYGLHGHSSSEIMWLDEAHIGQTADELIERGDIRPMMMVFPFVRYDSAQIIMEDMQDGKRGESQSARFVCMELLPYIDATFQTRPQREARYIGGFSMGGLFALEIGLRYPDLFSKVGAYSPALAQRDYSGDTLSAWLYPDDSPSQAQDMAGFAASHQLLEMSVYLDCGGDSDPFSQGVQSLYENLQARGICVEFHPHSGGHTQQEERLPQYLAFFSGSSN